MTATALFRTVFLLAVVALLAACATPRAPVAPARTPAEIRAEIVRLMPSTVRDREGWAADITAAFAAQRIEASTSNLCSVLAVTEQESTYSADPGVPNLGRIARAEIDRRAKEKHIPQLAVRAALALDSGNGRSYAERIAALRSEREMSLLYEELIGRVPLGQRLFADANPVRTGGPMQVSIAFAETHAREHGYPYEPVDGSIRREVFTRRGGMYFGIAHLLGYPASYERPIYRYADFNAGFYASRNAAFQNAVSLASGIPLAPDGDLLHPDRARTGATELAVRALGGSLSMGDARIRRELERQDRRDFEESSLYTGVFALADKIEGRRLPRAAMPRIRLQSPKIKRQLTTEWFATRVDARWQRCMQKSAAGTQRAMPTKPVASKKPAR
ncbi:MAG: DUF1615 domain-containing protein [Xanthomonadales bacterium]|nr:DUF1615 domain-containing protein [Xanthomonadales bacterium]